MDVAPSAEPEEYKMPFYMKALKFITSGYPLLAQ